MEVSGRFEAVWPIVWHTHGTTGLKGGRGLPKSALNVFRYKLSINGPKKTLKISLPA